MKIYKILNGQVKKYLNLNFSILIEYLLYNPVMCNLVFIKRVKNKKKNYQLNIIVQFNHSLTQNVMFNIAVNFCFNTI